MWTKSGKVSLRMGTRNYLVSPRTIFALRLLSRWAPPLLCSLAVLVFCLTVIQLSRLSALKSQMQRTALSIDCREMRFGCGNAAGGGHE